MRVRRGLFVLAIVAALWGAPSSVSAAVNDLSSPQVSPSSGSVTTVFTFRVRYEGGFPATSVTLSVAGLAIPLVLESGSLTAGWWTGSSLLPVGAWSTTFTALAPRGLTPTIDGPAVTVAGLRTPAPTATSGTAPGNGPTPESAPASDPGTATAPPAAPAPAPAEAPASATAPPAPAPAPTAPNSGPAPGGLGDSDAPSGDGAVSGSAEPEIREGSAAGGGGNAGDGQAAQGAPSASRDTETQPAGDAMLIRPVADTEPREDRTTADETVSYFLLIGLAGVASIALIGTLLLVAARRREPERATALATRRGTDTSPTRRVTRSSRAHAADDPIVAALGVDDEMAARRAIRRARRQADDGGAPARPPKGR